jgi:transcriptional regulator with XRE-family HTH domain
MDNRTMGRRLRELRRRKKQSLRALSRSSGIAVSFLSAIEQGKNNVSVAKLKSILDALGMGLGEFFSQDVQPPKIVYRKEELVEINAAEAAGDGSVTGSLTRNCVGRRFTSLRPDYRKSIVLHRDELISWGKIVSCSDYLRVLPIGV